MDCNHGENPPPFYHNFSPRCIMGWDYGKSPNHHKTIFMSIQNIQIMHSWRLLNKKKKKKKKREERTSLNLFGTLWIHVTPRYITIYTKIDEILPIIQVTHRYSSEHIELCTLFSFSDAKIHHITKKTLLKRLLCIDLEEERSYDTLLLLVACSKTKRSFVTSQLNQLYLTG